MFFFVDVEIFFLKKKVYASVVVKYLCLLLFNYTCDGTVWNIVELIGGDFMFKYLVGKQFQ